MEEDDNSDDSMIREETEFDFDKLFEDFGRYLDATPKQYDSRFQKWFRILMHSVLTLATAGAWVLGYTIYVFGKFFSETDMEKYEKKVHVHVLPEENESEEGEGLDQFRDEE